MKHCCGNGFFRLQCKMTGWRCAGTDVDFLRHVKVKTKWRLETTDGTEWKFYIVNNGIGVLNFQGHPMTVQKEESQWLWKEREPDSNEMRPLCSPVAMHDLEYEIAKFVWSKVSQHCM